MKKRLSFLIVAVFSLLLFVSCKVEETPTSPASRYDVPATEIDHYFSNQVRFSDTNTTVEKNSAGKLAGKFVKDKVAKLELKSITDGDTAVFHLDGETQSYDNPLGTSHDYVTVRFLAIDTPESTSSINPWGKAASKYVRSLLENAEGIIVDATDCKSAYEAGSRLDSNGSRWLALVWYCPDGGDAEDLTQYRSLQLDVIEECYSNYTGALSTSRYVYSADKEKEPKLRKEYEDQYGSLLMSDVLLEAELRMVEKLELRVHGEIDQNYDYSTTPKSLTIAEAYDKMEEYIEKGTFVEITGAIVRFVGSNLYITDANGKALYIYMGIDGTSISNYFEVGDTLRIRGRLCEYGGQYQMSGIEFKNDTFVKVTDPAQMITAPAPVKLKGNETAEQLEALMGCLVETELTVAKIGNLSKDYSYTVDSKTVIPGITTEYNKLSIRVNGTLAPGYETSHFTIGATYTVLGVMSKYYEEDIYAAKKGEANFPSYQIVPGNRPLALDADGEPILDADGNKTYVYEIKRK